GPGVPERHHTPGTGYAGPGPAGRRRAPGLHGDRGRRRSGGNQAGRVRQRPKGRSSRFFRLRGSAPAAGIRTVSFTLSFESKHRVFTAPVLSFHFFGLLAKSRHSLPIDGDVHVAENPAAP